MSNAHAVHVQVSSAENDILAADVHGHVAVTSDGSADHDNADGLGVLQGHCSSGVRSGDFQLGVKVEAFAGENSR